MLVTVSRREGLCNSFQRAIAAISVSVLLAAIPAVAQNPKTDRDRFFFWPGNLVVSRSVYDNNPNNVQVGTILPPNCASTQGGCSAATGAPYNGTYPYVWNNDTYDASFGITSKIYLDQLLPFGFVIDSLEVPNSSQRGISDASDQLVTSFSSKSEMAVNLSTDRHYLTFSGYVAPIDHLDVSNSNTPGVFDPTNPVGESVYRVVAEIDQETCIHCSKCYIACEDAAHQCIDRNVVDGTAILTIDQDHCVGCNLCMMVCPVDECITMVQVDNGLPSESWKERSARISV